MTSVTFARAYHYSNGVDGQDTDWDSYTLSWDFDLTPGDQVHVNESWNIHFYAGLTENGDLVTGTWPGSAIIYTNDTYMDGETFDFSAEDFPPCFLAGTRIASAGGPIPVESVRPGDVVLSATGASVAVRWVGRRLVRALFTAEARQPVKIAAGALGPQVPVRDLVVTSDHALLIDGALVQAGALVNGTTVRRLTAADLGDSYTVFHIETENHEVILAEGVAAETFVDNVSRRRFDNYAEYVSLYGEAEAAITEMALPRAKSARQLPQAVRERLTERACALGFSAAAAA